MAICVAALAIVLLSMLCGHYQTRREWRERVRLLLPILRAVLMGELLEVEAAARAVGEAVRARRIFQKGHSLRLQKMLLLPLRIWR
jgi:hypothetical protein